MLWRSFFFLSLGKRAYSLDCSFIFHSIYFWLNSCFPIEILLYSNIMVRCFLSWFQPHFCDKVDIKLMFRWIKESNRCIRGMRLAEKSWKSSIRFKLHSRNPWELTCMVGTMERESGVSASKKHVLGPAATTAGDLKKFQLEEATHSLPKPQMRTTISIPPVTEQI